MKCEIENSKLRTTMKIHALTTALRAKSARVLSSVAVLAAVLLGGGLIEARAAYAIKWSRIASGGGICRNGQYVLSGTLGQFEAGGGPMRGGNFAVTGGFWSPAALLKATPQPEPPGLEAKAVNGGLLIRWPITASGYILEQADGLGNGFPWSAAPGTPQISDGKYQVVVLATTPKRFFRLHLTQP